MLPEVRFANPGFTVSIWELRYVSHCHADASSITSIFRYLGRGGVFLVKASGDLWSQLVGCGWKERSGGLKHKHTKQKQIESSSWKLGGKRKHGVCSRDSKWNGKRLKDVEGGDNLTRGEDVKCEASLGCLEFLKKNYSLWLNHWCHFCWHPFWSCTMVPKSRLNRSCSITL